MMNKCVVALGIGLVEEEIDETAHLMQKNQKKMSRKAHRAYRKVCDCMEH